MRIQSSNSLMLAETASSEVKMPGRINVLLFRSIIKQLREDRRWVILNLGAALQQTIDLVSPYRCRMDIANLADSIDTVNAPVDSEEPDRFTERVAALLPAHASEPMDVVFCWDFLNYLDRDVLTELMSAIASRCRRGALLHALIAYSHPLMQEVPGRFAPLNESHLLSLTNTTPSRMAPRYSTDDLRACTPDFSIERVRLLGNGMQEYLFLR